jgi:hypothetical protein
VAQVGGERILDSAVQQVGQFASGRINHRTARREHSGVQPGEQEDACAVLGDPATTAGATSAPAH